MIQIIGWSIRPFGFCVVGKFTDLMTEFRSIDFERVVPSSIEWRLCEECAFFLSSSCGHDHRKKTKNHCDAVKKPSRGHSIIRILHYRRFHRNKPIPTAYLYRDFIIQYNECCRSRSWSSKLCDCRCRPRWCGRHSQW